MPYPNEHACRIRDPGDFEKDSFRRIQSGDKGGPGPRDGKKLSIIIGRLKGETSTTTATFRYPIDSWTEAQARAHCKEQGGKFEPAVPAKESRETISLREKIQEALNETAVEESATFKSMVQALLRSADSVASNKSVPAKVKTSLQNLRTLLHQTWGDIEAMGNDGTAAAGESDPGGAGSIEEAVFDESSGALLANEQPLVENGHIAAWS